MAAGMSLSRARYKTLLLERGRLGGQARLIDRIENYPGFPCGVQGGKLMDRWIRQARRWGLKFGMKVAGKVSYKNGFFRVEIGRGQEICARAVVRCTGARFKSLGIPGEKKFFGRGLYHAAFDEAPRCKDKDVAVVGGGEAATHQALYLARFASKVYLITKDFRLKAHPLLQKRAASRDNVVPIPCSLVEKVEGSRRLERVWLRHVSNGLRRFLRVQGLFVLIGKEPEAPGIWEASQGFFVAGDARGDRFRQVAIAGGDGVRAAMECMQYLEAVAAQKP